MLTKEETITITGFIKPLYQLTGVTRNDFKSLYVSTVQCYVDLLMKEKDSFDADSITIIMDKIIKALKRRRGYLLPNGSDSEAALLEQEQWTYAVFTAVLLQSVETNDDVNVEEIIVPKKGLAWLMRNAALFLLWQNYWQKNETNVFAEIIDGLCANRNMEIKPHDTVKSQPEEAAAGKTGNMTEPVKEEKSISDNAAVNDPTAINKTALIPKQNNSSDLFWHWLRDAINQQAVSINESDSFVHRVEIGLLICVKKAAEYFLKDKAMNSDNSKKLKETRIELMKEIRKATFLVRNKQNKRTHHYCFGRWEDRHAVAGIVAPCDLFVEKQHVFPVNSNLSVDPMGDS